VDVCERRDPKGHYQRAREGKIRDFTGVSAPYEEPADPELALDTSTLTIEESVQRVLELLRSRGIVAPRD
jgi:adenylylsulfate kinase